MNDLNNQQKKHVNIGLDIGTTSVGWAIIDNDYNVIDYGVRLFEDACEEKTGNTKNQVRRQHRSLRRLLHRRQHRKNRFIKLILKNNSIFSFNNEEEIKLILKTENELPWDVKVRGLSSQLTREKLIYILYHYLSHRGFSYLVRDDNSDRGNVDVNYLPEWVKNNSNIRATFSHLFPSQKQKLVFDKFGCQDRKLNDTFRMSWWKQEISKVLDNQLWLTNQFKKEYLQLFAMYRDYSIGPGSEKSPTPYGLWYEKYDNGFKKIVKKGDNLWDCLVGTCKWFDGSDSVKRERELRIEMNSASAIIFNLLNDLQNLAINGDTQTISSAQKKEVFVLLLNPDKKKTKLTCQKLAKILRCDKDDIYYRNSGKEPNFTDTTTLKFALKFLRINSIDFVEKLWQENFTHVNQINKLIHLVSVCKDSEKLYKEIDLIFHDVITNYGYKSGEELIKNEDFINIKKSKKYSAYSGKALNMFIPYLFNDEQGHNWEFICRQPPFVNNNSIEFHDFNSKCININHFKISENIFSPTVARSVRQTFKVINAILRSKKYSNYIIDNISIEMCCDNNTAEKRKREHEFNKLNNQKNKTINEYVDNLNINKTFEREIRQKLLLAESQGWKDPYDGKDIEKPLPSSEGLLYEWSLKHEVDHIIPYSYFHDNSWSNKVLTKKENNQDKGQKTPYERWGKLSIWTSMVKAFKPNRFSNNRDKSGWFLPDKEKIANFKIGSDGADILGKLPERKLVDTRYTTRFVLESLLDFFEHNSYYLNNKPGIFTINGHVSAFFRNKFGYDKKYNLSSFKKNRYNFKHHAIDAIIVALFSILPPEFVNLFRKCSSLYISSKINNFSDNIFLEKQKALERVINKKLKLTESFNEAKIRKISQWIENNKPRFSRMLITKSNCGCFDETAYSYYCDGNDNVYFKKRIGIFDSKIFDYLFGNKKTKCLLNGDELAELKKIYDCNKDSSKNPFQNYMETEYNEKESVYIKFMLNDIEHKIKKISFISLGNKKDKYFEDKKVGCIRKSFQSISIDCYGKNGNWYVIPLNVKTCTFKDKKCIKKQGYSDALTKYNLDDHNFKFNVKKGQTFINRNTSEIVYYVSYRQSANDIEIKPIDHIRMKEKNGKLEEAPRCFISLNSFFDTYEICDVDVLGNIYKRK